MSVPRSPGQDARANRGLNPEQLRADLSKAVERFDHHMREAQDLGRLNKTTESLRHLGLANDAARDCERLADQITALGRPATTTARPNRRSDWLVER